jgi:hypothetical protein
VQVAVQNSSLSKEVSIGKKSSHYDIFSTPIYLEKNTSAIFWRTARRCYTLIDECIHEYNIYIYIYIYIYTHTTRNTEV